MIDSDMKTAVEYGVTALWDRSKTADTAIEEIYDLYAPSLFRYALALTGRCDDAEDAIQDLFLRLTRESARLNRIRDMKSYLFTAIRNSAYSILRRKKSLNDKEQAVIHETGIIDESDSTIDAIALKQEFIRLPIEQRDVISLKAFEDLTFAEIAKIVGISANTAASRYRYGVDRLRRVLKEDSNG